MEAESSSEDQVLSEQPDSESRGVLKDKDAVAAAPPQRPAGPPDSPSPAIAPNLEDVDVVV